MKLRHSIPATPAPHSAVHIWSGFLYQGQVALYHALKLISEDFQSAKNYHLQLDSLDDFAIFNGPVTNQSKTGNTIDYSNAISMHQVKAVKSQLFSTYQDDFLRLKKRKSAEAPHVKRYFHLSSKITDKKINLIHTEYTPVSVYKYNEDFHCAIDDIESRIFDTLKEIYSIHDTTKNDSIYIEKTQNYINNLILTKVFKIHSNNHNGNGTIKNLAHVMTLPFSEIYDILMNNLSDAHEGYYISCVRKDFIHYINEYINDNITKIDDISIKKLNSYTTYILEKSNKELDDFIKSISIHKKNLYKNARDYKDESVNKSEIHIGFMKTLHELRDVDNKIPMMNWISNGKDYYPLATNKGIDEIESLCLDIAQNGHNNCEILFASPSTLITPYIDIEDVLNLNITKANYDNAKEHQRITSPKKMSLISRNIAKGKINA